MMTLSAVARIVQGEFQGADAMMTAVATDSRAINHGDLFVAIPGQHYDGHDFVSRAGRNGAVGAMVSRSIDTDLARIKVPDTTRAMGQLARHWRALFHIPVLAITGSNGKTTITAMAGSILNRCGTCLCPEKSFNNQWGVPLTLLKLNNRHDFAVIEMGTNHAGEIACLSQITRPTLALISNVSAAHLQGLESLEKIAQAKAEIYSGLSENHTAVVNADDPFSEQWMRQIKSRLKTGRMVSFGIEHPADVSASNMQSAWRGSRFDLNIGDQCIGIRLPLPGIHNISNALAAAAVCYAAGAGMEAIKTGLENVAPVPGRLHIRNGLNGSAVIDDSYNANPQSARSAMDMLAHFNGLRIAVLGAMAELGETSKQLHIEIGEYAKQTGISRLYCLADRGNMDAQHYAKGFGAGGRVYADIDQLVRALKNHLEKGVAVLVKGSRCAGMERIVDAITVDARGNNHTGSMSDYKGSGKRAVA